MATSKLAKAVAPSVQDGKLPGKPMQVSPSAHRTGHGSEPAIWAVDGNIQGVPYWGSPAQDFDYFEDFEDFED